MTNVLEVLTDKINGLIEKHVWVSTASSGQEKKNPYKKNNCTEAIKRKHTMWKTDFMLSLSDNNQADIIEAFNSTSRYLDDLLNIDNPYFEQMVGQIYPTELQLNKANSSDTEAPFLDLNLSITNGMVSSKNL